MKNFLSVLKRLGRAIVAVCLAGIPAYYQNEPLYIGLAPLIQAVGKWLRVSLGLKNVPF